MQTLCSNDSNFTNRDIWVNVVSHLVVTMKSLGQQKEYEIYLRKQFKDADVNSSGCLSFNECIKVLGQLNIKMEKEQLKKLFKVEKI